MKKGNLIKKISIGTAQFGMDYGINNNSGKIKKEEAFEILDFALENNINTLDTAMVYGDSEEIIGEYNSNNKNELKIITKINNLTDYKLDYAIKQILYKLKTDNIYGCLIHNFDIKNSKNTIRELKNRYKKKSIKKIGVSLYHTYDLEYILNNNLEIDLIQIPFNIFDRRFENYFKELKQKNIEIHIRSVYLQGLIFKDTNELNSYFNDFVKNLKELEKISNEFNEPVQKIALNFCLSNTYIDKVIIGIDNLNQFKQIVSITNEFEYSDKLNERLKSLSSTDERFILPFNWQLK